MNNYEKALDFFNKKEFNNALKFFLYSLAENINSSNSYYNLALTYEMTNDNELAIACYKKAVKIDKNIRAINNLAVMYFANGQEKNALSLLNTAIETCPNDAEAYSQMGKYYFKIKDFEIAKRYFNKAKQLDSNFCFNYYNLAKLYIALKDITKAKENLEECLRINPEFALAKEELKNLD